MAALGLCCCEWASSRCDARGLLSGGRSPWWPLSCGARVSGVRTLGVVVPRLQSTSSAIVVPGPSCPAACGIFLDQGSNPRLLHQQADSSPLSHQGSPAGTLLTGHPLPGAGLFGVPVLRPPRPDSGPTSTLPLPPITGVTGTCAVYVCLWRPP